MEQIFELTEHDDVYTVRDRLALAQSPRVLLVLPWDSHALRQRVDLQVVQRFAAANQIEVGIVSEEGEVRSAAREIGLPAFRSIGSAQRKKQWIAPIDEEDEHAPWQPSRKRKREAQQAAVERDRVTAQALRRSPHWRFVKWGLVLIVLLALGLSAMAIIPSAEIVLVPRTTQIIANVNVIADPDTEGVDPISAHVQATQVTVDIRDQVTIPTTGKKGIPQTRATGRVIFVNQLNTALRVSQGTAVRTSSGSQAVRFILTQDVDVPGGIGAQAEGTVEAVEPGYQSNVPANFINEVEGVASLAVRVSNPEAMSGGGEKEVRSVDPDDRDTARTQITPVLRDVAMKQLQAKLGTDEFIIPESLSGNILEATFDHEVTEQADDLTLLMRVHYTALKVNSADANSLVFTAMQNQAPKSYALIPEGLSFQRGAASPVVDSDTWYQFEMQGVGYAAANLDLAHATKSITGKSVEAASEMLKQLLPLKSDPKIITFPSWFPWLPWLSFRIRTEVNPQG
jgi:hypothetical protein